MWLDRIWFVGVFHYWQDKSLLQGMSASQSTPIQHTKGCERQVPYQVGMANEAPRLRSLSPLWSPLGGNSPEA
jgi:hypothetical protein